MLSRGWLWLNLLSLDAPLVLVAWQLLVRRSMGLGPDVPALLAWALSVWVVYMTDRLLDSFSAAPEEALPARHRFHRRHRRAVLALLVTASGATVYLACARLPAPILRKGLALAPVVASYLGVVHLMSSSRRRWFPKELAVALVFAAGCLAPALGGARRPGAAVAAAFGLLTLLCWFNCVLIEHAEWARLRGMDADPLHPWSFAAGRRLSGLCAAAALAAAGALAAPGWGWARPLFASELLSALALAWLALRAARLDLDDVRVLVDAALLTPGLFLLVPLR